MYDDSSIKLSKEAERINDLERLKRRFNNVNLDSSMSCENNSYLNTSMVSVSAQNTTSFENGNSLQNSQHIIDTNKSINIILNKNQNKVNLIVNKIDELIKLKSGKKRADESKIDSRNITNKKFEINFKKNQANLTQNRKERQDTPSTSQSKGKSFKFHPDAKAQPKEKKIEINNINNRFINKNQTDNNKLITRDDKTPILISTPHSVNNSNFNSEPSRNIISNFNIVSKSNIGSSHKNTINTIITNKTDSTHILLMNNIHTDKLITKGYLLRKNSHHSETSSNDADNISLIKFARKPFDNSLEIENEHSISNERIPSENEKEIDDENENYNNAPFNIGGSVEKIKTSAYFANKKKSNTNDTEVIRGDVEDNNSIIKKQKSFLTTRSFANSVINTLDRDNIFYDNPNWLLSNRLINDEKNCFNRQVTMAIPDYKFLGKIREDSRSAVAMKTKYFISLNEDAMYNLLTFIYDQYKILTSINKFIERKICLTLNNKFEKVVNGFRDNYREVFELQEFYFNHSEVKRINSNSYEGSVVDLVLKSKIVSKLVNKCIELSFVQKTNGKEYLQTWSFDLRRKKDIAIWFASEAEEVRYNIRKNIKRIKRTCYYQPIISFAKDDYIEFRINIFSRMGSIDPSSIKWMEIITYDTPEDTFLQYEKSLIKSNVEYDKLRCCELENVIHVWKSEKSLSRKENILDFKKVFKNNFKILSVDYDIAKFFIYKIRMKANCLGIVRKNKFANVDIEIKPCDDSIVNEIQCLGLLNVSHLSNKVEIRKSTVVIFYFTDLYL